MIRTYVIPVILFLLLALLFAGCSSPQAGMVSTPQETGASNPPPSTQSPTTDEPFPEVPRIDVQAVKAKLDRGLKVIILDSRSGKDYAASHIAGAVSLPIDDMSEPFDYLKGYDLIVMYCT